MVKKISAVLILIALAVVFCSTVSAAGDKFVFDEKKYLTADEAELLEKKAQEFSEKHGAKFVVVTADYEYDSGLKAVEKYGFNKNDDIVMLVISNKNGTYYYDLFTFPENSRAVSNREADRILDASAVYDNIKGGNIYAGADAFLDKAAKAYSGTLWGNPAVTFGVGLAVFLIMGLAITFAVIASYKKKMRSAMYPLDRYTKLDLTRSNDIFLGSNVTRVRINTNSTGSGGGGSSRGVGGSGHRGGR